MTDVVFVGIQNRLQDLFEDYCRLLLGKILSLYDAVKQFTAIAYSKAVEIRIDIKL